MRLALIASSLLAILAAASCAPMPLASVGHPGWVRTEQGCSLWSDNPFPAMSASWTGACDNGRAGGPGAATWRKAGKEEIAYDVIMKDGKAEGPGRYIATNGNRYDGNFRGVRRDGRGVWLMANLGKFAGEFHNGKFVIGAMSYLDGSMYDGGWGSHGFEGQGKITFTGGYIEGHFHNGYLNGLATSNIHGLTCVAQYRDGRHNGHASCRRQDGGFMELTYLDGKVDGPAIIVASNGTRYEGLLHDRKRSGHGVLTWGSGDRYDGEWSNGLPNGQGTLVTLHDVFSGQWKNGCFSDGRRVKALLVNDSRCGG